MAITLDYTPFPAVAELALSAGYGRARQQERENQQREYQLALAAQGQANQAAYQQQALGQQAYQREADRQFDVYRQQMIAQNQQRMFESAQARDMLRMQYGEAGDMLHDNAMLEKQGFQYSPDQQNYLNKLDEDWHAAELDEAIDPMQRASLFAQYIQKKSIVRPTAPRPKTADEVVEDNWVTRTLKDGTVVEGVKGERAGAVTVDWVESPAIKQRQMEFQNELKTKQFELAQAGKQQQLENQAMKMQMEAQQQIREMQMRNVSTQEKMKWDNSNNVQKAYWDYLNRLSKLQPPKMDPATRKTVGMSIEAQEEMLKRGFIASHGNQVRRYAPEIAVDLGLEPIPENPEDGRDESAFFEQTGQQPTESSLLQQPEVAAQATAPRPQGFDWLGQAAAIASPLASLGFESGIVSVGPPRQQASVETPPESEQMPRVTTPEQRAALPPGTRYIAPDGSIRTKQ
jgi:hypothetical protein